MRNITRRLAYASAPIGVLSLLLWMDGPRALAQSAPADATQPAAIARPAVPPAAAADRDAPPGKASFPAGQTEVRIELQRGAWRLLTRDVRIDGRDVGAFIVDAASASTILTAEAASRLRLPRRDGGRPWPGDPADDGARRIDTLELGGVTVSDMLCGVRQAPLSGFNVQVAGTIGADVLSRFPFTIDYAQPALVLHEPGAFKPPDGVAPRELLLLSASPRPGGNRHSLTRAPVPAVRARIDGEACSVLFGAGATPSSLVALPPLIQRRPELVRGGVALGGEVHHAQLRSLEFLGRTFTDLPLPTALVPSELATEADEAVYAQMDAVAHTYILEHYRVTFDYASRRLWAEPLAPVAVEQRLKDGLEVKAVDLCDWTPLMTAASRGDAGGVRALLAAGADPAAADGAGSTALHLASQRGSLEVVRLLLETAGGRKVLEGTTVDGHTPLLAAAVTPGAGPVLDALLAAGADVDAKSRPRQTALMLAALIGDADSVRRLLAHKARLDAADEEGLTALTCAAMAGSVECYDLLCAAGARPVATRLGANVLHAAAQSGNPDMVRRVVKDFPVDGACPPTPAPLVLAIGAMSPPAVAALLDAKADVNAAGEGGGTPLHAAAMHRDVRVVQMLLDRGAKADARTDDGTTPLMVAAQAGHAPIVELLLAHGADVNAQHKRDEGTALVYAVVRGDPDPVRLLLERGAKLDQAPGGLPLLALAAERGNAAVVRVLLEAKADVRATDRDDATALHYAATFGDAETIRLLLAAGADPNAAVHRNTNSHDARPLHFACGSGRIDAVRLLLAAGADPNAKLKDGATPLDMAREAGRARQPLIEDMIEAAMKKTPATASRPATR